MTEYYTQKLEEGLKYQDFICDEFRKMNPARIIMPYCSRAYQYQHGESASGYEIKYDGRMASTGNIWIEVAEKSSAYVRNWTDSGIMRKDNSVYYLIGDYKKAYIFSKHQLQHLLARSEEELAKCGIKKKRIPTSIGYVIPCDYIEQTDEGRFYCLELLQFEGCERHDQTTSN